METKKTTKERIKAYEKKYKSFKRILENVESIKICRENNPISNCNKRDYTHTLRDSRGIICKLLWTGPESSKENFEKKLLESIRDKIKDMNHYLSLVSFDNSLHLVNSLFLKEAKDCERAIYALYDLLEESYLTPYTDRNPRGVNILDVPECGNYNYNKTLEIETTKRYQERAYILEKKANPRGLLARVFGCRNN